MSSNHNEWFISTKICILSIWGKGTKERGEKTEWHLLAWSGKGKEFSCSLCLQYYYPHLTICQGTSKNELVIVSTAVKHQVRLRYKPNSLVTLMQNRYHLLFWHAARLMWYSNIDQSESNIWEAPPRALVSTSQLWCKGCRRRCIWWCT